MTPNSTDQKAANITRLMGELDLSQISPSDRCSNVNTPNIHINLAEVLTEDTTNCSAIDPVIPKKLTIERKIEKYHLKNVPFDAILHVTESEKLKQLNDLFEFVNSLLNEDSPTKCLECKNDDPERHRMYQLRKAHNALIQYYQFEPHNDFVKSLIQEKLNQACFLWDYYISLAIIPINEPEVVTQKKGYDYICSPLYQASLASWMKGNFWNGTYYGQEQPSGETQLMLAPNNERLTNQFGCLHNFAITPVRIERTNDNFHLLGNCHRSHFKADFEQAKTFSFQAENIQLGRLTGDRAQRFSEFTALGRNEIKQRYFPEDRVIPLQCWNFVQFIHSGATTADPCLPLDKQGSLEEIKPELDKLPFFHPLYMYTNGKPCHAVFYLGAGLVVSMIDGNIVFNKLTSLIPAYSNSGEDMTIGIVKIS